MEGIEPSASMSDELQSRIGRIALEAKQRNPNGYSLTPPRLKTSSLNPRGSQSASSGLVKPKFTPFVTASGQHIVFHDGKYYLRYDALTSLTNLRLCGLLMSTLLLLECLFLIL